MNSTPENKKLDVTVVRVFMPAKDFEFSKSFYLALGWQLLWSDNNLAVLEIANQRFYLQNYYVKDWAENFMIHVSVRDAQAWKKHVLRLIDDGRFPNIRVDGPRQEAYGVVTYVWAPCGVLLHFIQWNYD